MSVWVMVRVRVTVWVRVRVSVWVSVGLVKAYRLPRSVTFIHLLLRGIP